MKIAPGAVIAGRYRLEKRLAIGGMGSVWTAQHIQLDTSVAIKFMDANHTESLLARQRFEREAKTAASLRSAHVVHVHDYGVEDNHPFIVMELLRGEDLGRRLKRERRLSLEGMSPILIQIARGLRRAHESGLVHRDLKPPNIFMARDDEDDEIVKILDFGIAKDTLDPLVGEGTRSGELMGSPHFMSPEQIRGAKDIDYRSDLWSLGVLLFRAVTGSLPFRGDVVGAIIAQILADPIPIPSKLVPSFSPDVDAYFARAFSRDREARFQSAREMADAFAALSGDDLAESLDEWHVRRSEAPPPRPRDALVGTAMRSASASSPGSIRPAPLESSPDRASAPILLVRAAVARDARGSVPPPLAVRSQAKASVPPPLPGRSEVRASVPPPPSIRPPARASVPPPPSVRPPARASVPPPASIRFDARASVPPPRSIRASAPSYPATPYPVEASELEDDPSGSDEQPLFAPTPSGGSSLATGGPLIQSAIPPPLPAPRSATLWLVAAALGMVALGAGAAILATQATTRDPASTSSPMPRADEPRTVITPALSPAVEPAVPIAPSVPTAMPTTDASAAAAPSATAPSAAAPSAAAPAPIASPIVASPIVKPAPSPRPGQAPSGASRKKPPWGY